MPHAAQSKLMPLEKPRIPLRAVPTFVADERFVLTRKGDVPIELITADFKMHFSLVKEMGVAETTVVQHRLCVPLPLNGLARECEAMGETAVRKVHVALAHVYEFLKMATRDPRRRYLFCVPCNGSSAGVTSCWRPGGWFVGAVPGWHPDEFAPGTILVTQ